MISEKELNKLQKLSKLSISAEEAAEFNHKLESILKMIDKLHEVNCEDVEPLRSVCEMAQRMNKDVIDHNDLSSDLFQNVPGNESDFAKEIKCFIVPKVVE